MKMKKDIKKVTGIVMSIVILLNMNAGLYGQVNNSGASQSWISLAQYFQEELNKSIVKQDNARAASNNINKNIAKHMINEGVYLSSNIMKYEDYKKEAAKIYEAMSEEGLRKGYEYYIEIVKKGEETIEKVGKLVKEQGYLAEKNNKDGTQAILNYINKVLKENGYKEGKASQKTLALSNATALAGRICIEGKCYEKDNWLRGALRGYLNYYFSYYKAGEWDNLEIIKETAGEAGWDPADAGKLVEYLYGVVKKGDRSCSAPYYGSDTRPTEEKRKQIEEKQIKRCSDWAEAAVLLGVVAGESPYNKNIYAEKIYEIIRARYRDNKYANIVMVSGVSGLMALGSGKAYELLEKLLIEEMKPYKYDIRGVFNRLGDILSINRYQKIFFSIKDLHGFGGRYLNDVSEQFEMSVGKQAKANGGESINVNVLEEIGFILTETKQGQAIANKLINKYIQTEKKLPECYLNQFKDVIEGKSNKTAWNTISGGITKCYSSTAMNVPLVVGILQSGSINMKAENVKEAAGYLTESEWWDVNGVTQSRLRNIGRGVLGKELEVFDLNKVRRYREIQLALEAGFCMDIAIIVAMLPNLIKSIPSIISLITKAGISAVKIIRGVPQFINNVRKLRLASRAGRIAASLKVAGGTIKNFPVALRETKRVGKAVNQARGEAVSETLSKVTSDTKVAMPENAQGVTVSSNGGQVLLSANGSGKNVNIIEIYKDLRRANKYRVNWYNPVTREIGTAGVGLGDMTNGQLKTFANSDVWKAVMNNSGRAGRAGEAGGVSNANEWVEAGKVLYDKNINRYLYLTQDDFTATALKFFNKTHSAWRNAEGASSKIWLLPTNVGITSYVPTILPKIPTYKPLPRYYPVWTDIIEYPLVASGGIGGVLIRRNIFGMNAGTPFFLNAGNKPVGLIGGGSFEANRVEGGKTGIWRSNKAATNVKPESAQNKELLVSPSSNLYSMMPLFNVFIPLGKYAWGKTVKLYNWINLRLNPQQAPPAVATVKVSARQSSNKASPIKSEDRKNLLELANEGEDFPMADGGFKRFTPYVGQPKMTTQEIDKLSTNVTKVNRLVDKAFHKEYFIPHGGFNGSYIPLPTGKTYNVLIVNDEPPIYAKDIKNNQLSVETATSGKEAVNKLKNGSKVYDIVFSDIHMNGMNGFELANYIRESTDLAKMPIIVALSGGLDGVSPEWIYERNFDGALDIISASPSSIENYISHVVNIGQTATAGVAAKNVNDAARLAQTVKGVGNSSSVVMEDIKAFVAESGRMPRSRDGEIFNQMSAIGAKHSPPPAELITVIKRINNDDYIKNDYEAFKRSISVNYETEFVTDIPIEILRAEYDVYLLKGYNIGFAIRRSDGYGVNFHNNSGIKEVFRQDLAASMQRLGVKYISHYSGHLNDVYEKMGLKSYEIKSWDDKLAPVNWDYQKYGRPDIIYRSWTESVNAKTGMTTSQATLKIEQRLGTAGGAGTFQAGESKQQLLQQAVSGTSALDNPDVFVKDNIPYQGEYIEKIKDATFELEPAGGTLVIINPADLPQSMLDNFPFQMPEDLRMGITVAHATTKGVSDIFSKNNDRFIPGKNFPLAVFLQNVPDIPGIDFAAMLFRGNFPYLKLASPQTHLKELEEMMMIGYPIINNQPTLTRDDVFFLDYSELRGNALRTVIGPAREKPLFGHSGGGLYKLPQNDEGLFIYGLFSHVGSKYCPWLGKKLGFGINNFFLDFGYYTPLPNIYKFLGQNFNLQNNIVSNFFSSNYPHLINPAKSIIISGLKGKGGSSINNNQTSDPQARDRRNTGNPNKIMGGIEIASNSGKSISIPFNTEPAKFVLKIEGDNYWGSAVLVEYSGLNLLLTDSHVLDAANKYAIYNSSGELIGHAEVYKDFTDRDFAALTFSEIKNEEAYKDLQAAKVKVNQTRDILQKGEEVYLVGYSDGKFTIRRGVVQKTKRLHLPDEINPYLLFQDEIKIFEGGQMKEGSSGGVVLRENGDIVGMIQSRDLKSSVNFVSVSDFQNAFHKLIWDVWKTQEVISPLAIINKEEFLKYQEIAKRIFPYLRPFDTSTQTPVEKYFQRFKPRALLPVSLPKQLELNFDPKELTTKELETFGHNPEIVNTYDGKPKKAKGIGKKAIEEQLVLYLFPEATNPDLSTNKVDVNPKSPKSSPKAGTPRNPAATMAEAGKQRGVQLKIPFEDSASVTGTDSDTQINREISKGADITVADKQVIAEQKNTPIEISSQLDDYWYRIDYEKRIEEAYAEEERIEKKRIAEEEQARIDEKERLRAEVDSELAKSEAMTSSNDRHTNHNGTGTKSNNGTKGKGQPGIKTIKDKVIHRNGLIEKTENGQFHHIYNLAEQIEFAYKAAVGYEEELSRLGLSVVDFIAGTHNAKPNHKQANTAKIPDMPRSRSNLADFFLEVFKAGYLTPEQKIDLLNYYYGKPNTNNALKEVKYKIENGKTQYTPEFLEWYKSNIKSN